jgi:hypothetical protein
LSHLQLIIVDLSSNCLNIQFLKGCWFISMSESLRNALEASETPILSRPILATGEDFVVTFLNSTRVVDTGFMLFKLDTEICKNNLSRRGDFKKNKIQNLPSA